MINKNGDLEFEGDIEIRTTLSDKRKEFVTFPERKLNDKLKDGYYYGEDVKKSIKEILFHKKCLNCKLNICNCGKEEWVVDVDVIKEEFGDKLL